MPDFIPGLELSRRFYAEEVRPLLDQHFLDLPHNAALIGPGSEVLGFDTEMSTDHHWGPRVILFLSQEDHARHAESIRQMLAQSLPYTFLGYATNFVRVPDEPVTMLLQEIDEGPVNHRVEIRTLHDFCVDTLGFDPLQGIIVADWLCMPQQVLRTMVAGQVFHDGLGTLEPLRDQLAYYPDEIWRYTLAAQWQRISQEEPFVGRTGSVGDEHGSQILAARLVRDVMRLGFLMERTYAPYSKWFGTAFTRLKCAAQLSPLIDAALHADSWEGRQDSLAALYQVVAALHNDLGITEPLSTAARSFHNRPFKVIGADRFAEAIRATLTAPAILHLPPYRGGIDQWVDSTDVLSDPAQFRKLRSIYE